VGKSTKENSKTKKQRIEEQIIWIPKQVESGIPVVDVPHEHNLFQGNSAEKPNSAA
jgi:hypothetical protein